MQWTSDLWIDSKLENNKHRSDKKTDKYIILTGNNAFINMI